MSLADSGKAGSKASSPRFGASSRHGKHLWRIRKMIKIVCPECTSDQIIYTADLENGDDLAEPFLCVDCGELFYESEIAFETINI